MPSIPEDELSKAVRAILQKPAAKMWNTGSEEYDDLPSYEQMLVEFIRQYAAKARIDELELHQNLKCICEESGINACDSLWHHNNNIDERIKQLKKGQK